MFLNHLFNSQTFLDLALVHDMLLNSLKQVDTGCTIFFSLRSSSIPNRKENKKDNSKFQVYFPKPNFLKAIMNYR